MIVSIIRPMLIAMNMKRLIVLDGRTTEYTLARKRVKNVNLRVRGGEVFVSAPRRVPLAVIEAFLREHAAFILAAAERTKKPAPSGDGAAAPYYRGRPLALRLSCAPRTALRLEGGTLQLALRDPEDGEAVRRALGAWLRAESERLCREALERLYPRFAPLGVPRPAVKMRAMRACWGNCRPKTGTVTFNARLAAVPDACLEYVVAHELTHFLHADHSPAFYAALARVVPDWRARRKTLRDFAFLLND